MRKKTSIRKYIAKTGLSFLLSLSIFSCSVYAATYDNGWYKVNGVYVNPNGTEIPGAYKRGIDISSHQGVIDWEKVAKDDVNFAFIRCGSSTTLSSADDKFEYNCENAIKNGIPIGIYYRTNAQTPEVARCEAYYTLSRISKYTITYPVAIDVEGNSIANLSKEQLTENIIAFCEVIKEAGYIPCVYASTSWFNHKIGEIPYKKWVAQYNSACNISGKISFWQCSCRGRIDGISGNVDIDFQIKFPKKKSR